MIGRERGLRSFIGYPWFRRLSARDDTNQQPSGKQAANLAPYNLWRPVGVGNCASAEKDRTQREIEAWAAASSADTAEAYEAFIKEWPDSQQSRAASNRLNQPSGSAFTFFPTLAILTGAILGGISIRAPQTTRWVAGAPVGLTTENTLVVYAIGAAVGAVAVTVTLLIIFMVARLARKTSKESTGT
jgi:hypothetical protein